MVDWDEIKSLQAAFQTAQLSTTTQKLSERNCIEILMKLQEMKLLDVLHTADGKEYLTPKQLVKEIKNELYMHGGRVNLVELQRVLNVDFSHIETKTSNMIKNDQNLQLVYGQLLESTYLNQIAEEINDSLQSIGQVTIAELSKVYDLPREFLLPELLARLNSVINGKLDKLNKDVIYTEAYIARHKARICGVLTAVTRPISLGSLTTKHHLSMQLLFAIIESLISENRIKGQIAGGRSEKSVYLPDLYTQSQNQWVDNFFEQNNYLEFDAVSSLGISDPRLFIKKRFGDKTFMLKSVCIGGGLVDLVVATIDETLTSGEWTDIAPILPSSFCNEDCNQLLHYVMKERRKHKNQINGIIFAETIVASQAFFDSCLLHFETLIHIKADNEAKKASVFALTADERKMYVSEKTNDSGKIDKKDDQRKKTNEGSGSARQAGDRPTGGAGVGSREVKTKGKDKKRLKWKKQEEAQADFKPTQKGKPEEHKFMDVPEIEDILQYWLSHCPKHFIRELAAQLHRPLSIKFKSAVQSVFLLTIQQKKEQRSQSSKMQDKNKFLCKSRKQLEEDTNIMWSNARLFAESFKLFDDNVVVILQKHLLKGICLEIINILFIMMASEFLLGVEIEKEINAEVKMNWLSRFPENIRKVLTKLSYSSNKTFEEFSNSLFDAVGVDGCDVKLRGPDKKKDRQTIHTNKISLLKQIENETDPALLLHLSSVCIFQNVTGLMINAPGKCVPNIISKLEHLVDQNVYHTLLQYQDLVITSVRLNNNSNKAELENGKDKIKKLAATTKKFHN